MKSTTQATVHRGNPRKHGLATPISAASDLTEVLCEIRSALAGPKAGSRMWEAADRTARSFLELRRIQVIKNALLEHYSKTSSRGLKAQHFSSGERINDAFAREYAFAYCDAQLQLKAIHRYERRAQSQFRRGMREYTSAREQEIRLKSISLNKQSGAKDER